MNFSELSKSQDCPAFGIHVYSLRRMCAIVSDDDHNRDKVGFEKVVAAHVHINIITPARQETSAFEKKL